MPTKKKKITKNAFYFYMEKYKAEMQLKGHKFPGGMKDVADAADNSWKSLSPAERRQYEEAATEWKRKERGNPGTKYTTQGVSYAVIEQRDRDLREQEYRMNTEIEGTVRALDHDTLATKPFYLVHLNYYCRTENNLYIPCEVALAEFTFTNGVQNSYHAIINPQVLPLGYTLDARRMSEETHQIPLPPNDLGIKDKNKLFREIKAFIQEFHTGDKLPPLYTQPNLIPAVKCFFSSLVENAQESDDLFRIYTLPKLFFELRNACANGSHMTASSGKGFPVLSLAERELDRDVFNFTPGISCEFHEPTDAIQYCSLSFVKRWCYLVADHGCQDLGIDLIPGKHIPMFTDTERYLKAMGKSRKNHAKSPDKESTKEKVCASRIEGKNITNSLSSSSSSSFKICMENATSHTEDFKPLRLPKTSSIAVSENVTSPIFSFEEFPPIEDARGFGKEPIMVAGRGRSLGIQQTAIAMGRGRGLAANFENLSLK